MQENVGQAVIRNDEAKTLGDVEPLYPAADVNEIELALAWKLLITLMPVPIKRLRRTRHLNWT